MVKHMGYYCNGVQLNLLQGTGYIETFQNLGNMLKIKLQFLFKCVSLMLVKVSQHSHQLSELKMYSLTSQTEVYKLTEKVI